MTPEQQRQAAGRYFEEIFVVYDHLESEWFTVIPAVAALAPDISHLVFRGQFERYLAKRGG